MHDTKFWSKLGLSPQSSAQLFNGYCRYGICGMATLSPQYKYKILHDKLPWNTLQSHQVFKSFILITTTTQCLIWHTVNGYRLLAICLKNKREEERESEKPFSPGKFTGSTFGSWTRLYFVKPQYISQSFLNVFFFLHSGCFISQEWIFFSLVI